MVQALSGEKLLKLNKTQCGVLLKFLNKHILYYKTGQNKKETNPFDINGFLGI